MNFTAIFGNGYNYVAVFEVLNRITLIYDSTLGTASYTRDVQDGNVVHLSATPNQNAMFIGWYADSVLISESLNYTYTLTHDTTVEARFLRIYSVTVSSAGNGEIDFVRQSTNPNIVTITVIPDEHYRFNYYEVNGEVYRDTPLTLTLTQDINVIAYFEEDIIRLNVTSNFKNASFYISQDSGYTEFTATVWARPFPDYMFVKWEDGSTENPRTITVTQDVTLIAIYHRVTDTNGIYQYRCFIKDQLDMTAPPKAFMVVDTFTVRTDLLTNATSDIVVLDTISNVNEGDVLVLYDPKGQFLYNGVINSIEDKTIQCSQMQSFYKGTWIYNTSSQDFLEHELAVLLQDYANGRLRGSSYVDNQVKNRLSGITIDYIGTTTASLPTTYQQEEGEDTNYETVDMEEFIYEMYRRYGVVFDFEINMSGTNYVHIKVPSYAKISVGNNMFAIQDMSPITEIEETNKLVVYGSDNTYRTTYIATRNGIVEAPTSTANRFNITNTVVVFSDDPIADLVASNLPQTMYNHKLTFVLLIKNFIYEFGDFNLGGELDVYYGDDYYNSVLTGYEISKSSNQNITEALFTCGMVRKALTKLLTLGKV